MTKIWIFRILGFAFILFQVMGYYGSRNVRHDEVSGSVNVVAYYIGFNFFLLIGLILLFISYRLQRKLKKNNDDDMIDSIGRKDDDDELR